jgi:NitT/TauT family transport system substrate-binding protein
MMIRNFRMPFAAAALVLAAVTGCAGGSSSSSATLTDASANITLAVVPSVNNTPAYIAQYEGFFARQGLHVTIKSMPSSAVVIADQLKGTVDICAGAYLPYIAQQVKGAHFRVLAEGSVMGVQDRVLLTRPGSPITSLRQLTGKTIGLEATDSIGTLLVSAALQEDGISPASVHFVTNPTGFKTMAKELAAGKYDAAFFGEPYATQAEEQYGDPVLAALGQGATQGLPFSGFTATQQWVDGHEATAAAFVRAIEQAQLVAATDTSTLRQAIDKSDNLSPIVGAVMALPGFPVGPVNATRLDRAANTMLEFGEINKKYSATVTSGSVISSMIDPNLQTVLRNSDTSSASSTQ